MSTIGGPPIPVEVNNDVNNAERRDEHLDGDTPVESPDGEIFKHIKVDTHQAAQLEPSRLHGSGLIFMVTFVAGTGVSASVECGANMQVYPLWLRSRRVCDYISMTWHI